MREPKLVDDIGCIPTDGTDYTGKANTTVNGLTCKEWTTSADKGHNFCRNPGSSMSSPWCFTTDPAVAWEYCDVPECKVKDDVDDKKPDEDIGCIPTDGSDYVGKANTTENGRTCKEWTTSADKGHNFCRNPSNSMSSPWCFTTDPAVAWEYCDVPDCTVQDEPDNAEDKKTDEDIGCIPTDGSDYIGKANKTENGRSCKEWTTSADKGHNFCRNRGNSMKTLWCFTTDPAVAWEYCDVPECTVEDDIYDAKLVEDVGCIPTDGTDYVGKANTTENGRTCKEWTTSADKGHNFCRNRGNSMKTLWCFTTDPAVAWEYCDVPECKVIDEHDKDKEGTKGDEKMPGRDIGCIPIDGSDYLGKANTTVSGRTCKEWTTAADKGHNFCRNPGSSMSTVYCFTTDPEVAWEYCEVPDCTSTDETITTTSSTTAPTTTTPPPTAKDIGCIPTDDSPYKGKASTTVSGLMCKEWEDQQYAGHNYCRNPGNAMKTVWCWTTDPTVLFELCDVPYCGMEPRKGNAIFFCQWLSIT